MTRETPYLITEPVHLYNLAWLQYLGIFNQVDTEGNIKQQYYFRLENDINMNGLILPPIGTTEYPFVGNFNGNQKVITVPRYPIIWPIRKGMAALAFTQNNKNNERLMSVYEFERVSATEIRLLSETEFLLPDSVKNGDIVYYEYEITEDDVLAKHEYAIGVASSYDNTAQNAGFFIMVLAGTNVEGGDQGGGEGGGEGGETTPVHRLSGINFVDAALLNSDNRDISAYPTVTLSLTVNNDTHAPATMAYARVSTVSMTYQLGGKGAASCSVSSLISEGVTVSTSTSLITAQLRAMPPPRKEEYTIL